MEEIVDIAGIQQPEYALLVGFPPSPLLSVKLSSKLVAMQYWRDIGVLRQSISAIWPCHFRTAFFFLFFFLI